MRSLQITNYAIIDHLDIDLSDRLTIITGETGAGKSIILGALSLILGKRADTSVLYHKEEKCIVEGIFVNEEKDLVHFFSKHDIDYDPEIIIRREINPKGKSRAFINDIPVTLPILRELVAQLIDLLVNVLFSIISLNTL